MTFEDNFPRVGSNGQSDSEEIMEESENAKRPFARHALFGHLLDKSKL
jgi:hypothetical protein